MPKKTITAFIDLFYPPFRKLMPIQTFRYAACGGANLVLDNALYYISYKYILKGQILHLGFYAFEPSIGPILMAFCVTFPVGFLLSKYVVWTQSNIRGHVQLFRYFLLVLFCLLLNYVFIKLFVNGLGLYPPLAKIITTVFVVIFSYLSQKYFTFRVKQQVVDN
ncbi:MAG: GtrA family protein [Ferruginibacter sp.]